MVAKSFGSALRIQGGASKLAYSRCPGATEIGEAVDRQRRRSPAKTLESGDLMANDIECTA